MKFLKKKYIKDIKNISGIFCHNINSDTTKKIVDFYKVTPFPNYQGLENKFSFLKVIKCNPFLNDLKKTIGFNKTFIEVGSGTSQLSISMAIGTNNLIVAMDPTFESLSLGKSFAKKNKINNVIFLNADIFDDIIEDNYFDFVWCSGVLHHTINSKKGFEVISRWVKPDGIIIIGVYNKIGRLLTNFRQLIYKLLGKTKFAKKLIFIMDPHLNKDLSSQQKQAWFRDQYEHPVERKHSFDEVIEWFNENEINYLGSVPSLDFDLKQINYMQGNIGTYFQRLCAQISILFSNLGREGGLFIVIGQKK